MARASSAGFFSDRGLFSLAGGGSALAGLGLLGLFERRCLICRNARLRWLGLFERRRRGVCLAARLGFQFFGDFFGILTIHPRFGGFVLETRTEIAGLLQCNSFAQIAALENAFGWVFDAAGKLRRQIGNEIGAFEKQKREARVRPAIAVFALPAAVW